MGLRDRKRGRDQLFGATIVTQSRLAKSSEEIMIHIVRWLKKNSSNTATHRHMIHMILMIHMDPHGTLGSHCFWRLTKSGLSPMPALLSLRETFWWAAEPAAKSIGGYWRQVGKIGNIRKQSTEINRINTIKRAACIKLLQRLQMNSAYQHPSMLQTQHIRMI